MTPTDDVLLDLLEAGALNTPMCPGRTWRVEIPGVLVRDSPLASHRANQVALARLGEHDADATIARVRDHFGGRRFGWSVGPRSTPVDLARRLGSAGLTMFREHAGLVLRDLAQPIAAPTIAIRRATDDDAEQLAALYVSSFGQDLDEARFLQQLAFAQPRLAVWLAIERDELLGFGQSFITDEGVLLLIGAATLPHARNRGVYRALLRHRIALAHAEGASVAIIQANVETSAPICARIGFVEMCRLQYWVG